MTANIWKEGRIVFWGIGVALNESNDRSGTRQWEGTIRLIGKEPFDLKGCYRLEFEEGESADVVLTHLLRGYPAIVHFRVLAWRGKPQATNNVAEWKV